MMLWKGKESNLLYMPLPSILPSSQKKPMVFLLQLCQKEVKSRLDSKFAEKVNKYNNTQVTYFLYQKSWKSKVHDEVPKELTQRNCRRRGGQRGRGRRRVKVLGAESTFSCILRMSEYWLQQSKPFSFDSITCTK